MKVKISYSVDIEEVPKRVQKLIDEISVVKPGFINIKFKPIFWTNFIKEIIQNSKSYGINNNESKKR